ncbi:BTB/POZ domain containing protein, partial [Trypanosoma grayi]|uniref:BTB/POZ domain containing protein n=1 Tax=Trypanosoma grayi TaxID=71804 RepID=UPI0004F4B72D
MVFGLEGHTATLYGEWIVTIGGKTAAFDLNESVLSLNIVTCEWRQMLCDGVAPLPRAYHSTCLHGSRLIVFGGITAVGVNDIHYNTYNVFTAADGLDRETLQQTGRDRLRDPSLMRPLIPQRLEPDGPLYVLDMSVSPPRWETLRCGGSVPCCRSHHAAAVHGDAMYVVGGYNIHAADTQPTPDFGCVYRLDVAARQWTAITLRTPLYYWGATLTPLGGTLICLFGGVSRISNAESHDTFLLDMRSGGVQALAPNARTPLPR